MCKQAQLGENCVGVGYMLFLRYLYTHHIHAHGHCLEAPESYSKALMSYLQDK